MRVAPRDIHNGQVRVAIFELEQICCVSHSKVDPVQNRVIYNQLYCVGQTESLLKEFKANCAMWEHIKCSIVIITIKQRLNVLRGKNTRCADGMQCLCKPFAGVWCKRQSSTWKQKQQDYYHIC